MKKIINILVILIFCSCQPAPENYSTDYDVLIVGGTPAGIMAGIAAAREGHTALILERNKHIGGLPANGLGNTDIITREATGGLFKEFVDNILEYYQVQYGPGSPQARASSQGYRFEPSVAEKIFWEMINAEPNLEVLTMRQFDHAPSNTRLEDNRLKEIKIFNRATQKPEIYTAQVFIDATYEGDLAAAAGAPYRLGRESRAEHGEAMAGKIYKKWEGPVSQASTFEADSAIQAYNFRMCLTADPDNSVPISKPANYNREEFVSFAKDLKAGTIDGFINGINAALFCSVGLPNEKFDSNNHHGSMISTDLPEENWLWPEADWAWRDQFAERLRDYTLGFMWFCQHDTLIPLEYRREAQRYGLAKDEYQDNDHFPRQVYVREGRRIMGEYLFTANDALPIDGARPPVHQTSITASHYDIDSHAVRKREDGMVHLDGFMSFPTKPYTVPLGVIIPQKIDGLIVPVAVSATHAGFGTLRMEPCWMAMGHAAGLLASVSIRENVEIRQANTTAVQDKLLDQKSVLIYFEDAAPGHPYYKAIQHFGLTGMLGEWKVRPDEPVTPDQATEWASKAGIAPPLSEGDMTRGAYLHQLYLALKQPS